VFIIDVLKARNTKRNEITNFAWYRVGSRFTLTSLLNTFPKFLECSLAERVTPRGESRARLRGMYRHLADVLILPLLHRGVTICERTVRTNASGANRIVMRIGDCCVSEERRARRIDTSICQDMPHSASKSQREGIKMTLSTTQILVCKLSARLCMSSIG
jgi:hypothetical protein